MVVKLKSYLANLKEEGHEVPTITDLADEIGVSRPHMYKIAAGKTDFKISAVAGIISAMRRRGFEMQVTDLIDYRED